MARPKGSPLPSRSVLDRPEKISIAIEKNRRSHRSVHRRERLHLAPVLRLVRREQRPELGDLRGLEATLPELPDIRADPRREPRADGGPLAPIVEQVLVERHSDSVRKVARRSLKVAPERVRVASAEGVVIVSAAIYHYFPSRFLLSFLISSSSLFFYLFFTYNINKNNKNNKSKV